jgi:carboxyl-terminal processing protease
MLRLPKIVTGAAVAGALLMLGITSGHTQVGRLGSTTPSVETSRQLELLGRLLDIVRSEYVDKPDDGKLLTSAINGILSALDPHSSYLDAKSYRDMRAATRGEFGGLGMQVNMEDGLLKVVSPIDDTPAAKAGILAGDVIKDRRGSDQRSYVEQAVERCAVRLVPGSARITRRSKQRP